MTKTPTHNSANKNLKDIVLLFSIPIGIILALVAFIYVPRLFANPGYDFVYCEGYYCDNRFSVGSNGNLQEAPDKDSSTSYRPDAKLFYYDVERDATRPLQVDEATRYRLDPSSKSPDGYILKYNSGSGGFLFWGGGSSWSLNKGLAARPVSFGSGYGDSKFIGWTLE